MKQKTTWYTLVLNNKFAELATKYFQIGELLFIRGIPHATAWIEDGEAKANLEVIVKEIGQQVLKNRSNYALGAQLQ